MQCDFNVCDMTFESKRGEIVKDIKQIYMKMGKINNNC